MPRRDGTGPAGMGAMTGWGAGRCTGSSPADVIPGAGGRGSGRGPGRGFWGSCGAQRGFRGAGLFGWMRFRQGDPSQNPAPGKPSLEVQMQAMESRLDDIQRRLDGIEPGSSGK
jgi:hypothetical protein